MEIPRPLIYAAFIVPLFWGFRPLLNNFILGGLVLSAAVLSAATVPKSPRFSALMLAAILVLGKDGVFLLLPLALALFIDAYFGAALDALSAPVLKLFPLMLPLLVFISSFQFNLSSPLGSDFFWLLQLSEGTPASEFAGTAWKGNHYTAGSFFPMLSRVFNYLFGGGLLPMDVGFALLSAVTAFLLYLVLKRLFGKDAAILSSVLMFAGWNQVLNRLSANEMSVQGTISLLFILVLLFWRARRGRALSALAGLVAGAGMLNKVMFAYFLAPFLLFAVIFRVIARPSRKEALFFSAFFLLAFSPFILHNVLHGWQSVLSLAGRARSNPLSLSALPAGFRLQAGRYGEQVQWAILPAALAGALYLASGHRKGRPEGMTSVFACTLLVFLLLISLSPEVNVTHLHAALFLFPLCIGAFLAPLADRRLILPLFAFSLALCALTASGPAPDVDRTVFINPASLRAFVSAENVGTIYAGSRTIGFESAYFLRGSGVDVRILGSGDAQSIASHPEASLVILPTRVFLDDALATNARAPSLLLELGSAAGKNGSRLVKIDPPLTDGNGASYVILPPRQ